VSRRVSLPAADDLFRPTADKAVRAVPDAVPTTGPATGPDAGQDSGQDTGPETGTSEDGDQSSRRKPSGRVRHDEKMTVYVTSDELLDLEHTRLMLRRHHGMAVDRGRLVREAISLVLADFEANGDESVLVRRLTDG
jgi:hypothetical protein